MNPRRHECAIPYVRAPMWNTHSRHTYMSYIYVVTYLVPIAEDQAVALVKVPGELVAQPVSRHGDHDEHGLLGADLVLWGR